MNDLPVFLRTLWQQGLELWLDQGQLGFRASKQAAAPENLAILRENKPQIIALIEAQADRYLGFPLSKGQQSIKLMQDLDPSSIAYNQLALVQLHRELSSEHLQQALAALSHHHPQLRATFDTIDDIPRQLIHEQLEPEFSINNANDMSETELVKWARKHAQVPFDLTNGPLLRCHILINDRSSGQTPQIVMAFIAHHIIADFWTMEQLLKELQDCYEALLDQQPINLSKQKQSYKDFICSEQAYLNSEKGNASGDYWQQVLANDDSPILEFETDKERPSQQSFRGAEVLFPIDVSLSNQIRTTAKRLQVTPFTFVLSAFQMLLHRYCREDFVVVGTPMACRQHSAVQNIVGHFTNPVPITADFTDNPSLNDLLQANKQKTQEALIHQDYPFQSLLDRIQPTRDSSRAPIFQTAISWNQQSIEREYMGAGNAIEKALLLEQCGALYDLVLTGFDNGSTFSTTFRYNSDIFESGTIKRIARHFAELLRHMCEDSSKNVGDYTFISNGEAQQLNQWNASETSYPADRNLAAIFERQVHQRPNHIALEFGDQTVSYGKLNTRANSLANWLSQQGIGADDCVGLAFPRSIDMITGIIATLKLGAIYVPIDPDYPEERLGFMIEDTEAPIVLMRQQDLAKFEGLDLGAIKQAPRFCAIETQRAAIKVQSRDFSITENAGDGSKTACIIFTSGSTGRPKGTCLPHRGLARLVLNTNYCNFTPDHKVSHNLNISFDAVSWEIWGALLNGSTLVGVDKDTLLDPAALDTHFEKHGVNYTMMTTALFNLMVSEKPTIFRNHDGIYVGGEAVDAQKMSLALEHSKPKHLVNVYGPTETSVLITTYEITEIDPHAKSVPIGQPIANTTCYVLDKYGHQCPIGVPGEICAGGPGIALRYLKRPELSAEKFKADPFCRDGSGSLYATGDLGRWNYRGEVEIIGRMDDQVKIRGFRIEPGEIENTLNNLAMVQKSTVQVREHAQRGKYIAAYIVPQHAASDDYVHQVRAALKELLAEYMMPSAYVVMDELPINANGKIDRRALPEPEISSEAEYVAPSSEMEIQIAGVWRQLLGIDKLGIHDNFFDLGGHSLLATQAASRLQEVCGQQVTMRDIFQAPDIAALAIRLSAGDVQSHYPALTPQNSGQEPAFASLAQQRIWFIQQLNRNSVAYSMPSAFYTGELSDVAQLTQAITLLLERHETLRTRLLMQDGKAIQVVDSTEQALSLEILDWQGQDDIESQLSEYFAAFISEPFDLAEGPLAKFKIIITPSQRPILAFNVHHIIADGWSANILFKDLADIYRHISNNSAQLEPLSVQYCDYAQWQRDWLQGDILEGQITYWREHLKHTETVLQLPTDFPRPAEQSFNGAVYRRQLSVQTSQQLTQFAHQHNSSLFMVLMAAYSIVLSRYSGQQDLCIGFPIAGRNVPELEDMIGLFVNNLPLRCDLSDDPSISDYLQRLRQNSIEAFDNQDVPFDILVEALNIERNLAYTPLTQVSLVLQKGSLDDLARTHFGDGAKPIDLNLNSAKYDLNLVCYEAQDGLELEMEYARDIFDEATISDFIDHFEAVLAGLQDQSNKRLSDIQLLSEQQKQNLLYQWNDTAHDYQAPAALHTLFEAQAAKQPELLAVKDQHSALSYGELNQRANQLAHFLRETHQIGPDSLVGVCMLRSIDMSVALLAIHKAGAAYVPFDPAFPSDRLGFMAEDTAISVLLSQADCVGSVPDAEALTKYCLDQDQQQWANQSSENPTLQTQPEHLFNLIYTSGSTGKPKGVMVPQAGVINRILWMQDAYPLSSDDTVFQKTPYSFDVSVWELFWPLIVGANIYYAKPEGHKDPNYLRDTIVQENISTLHFVPSMLGIFLLSDDIENCTSVRQVFCSGEALALEHERRFFERFDGNSVGLHNLYGPTEASIDVSYYACQANSQLSSVPIGKPVTNTQLHIFDSQLQPVPVGVVGELYLGGVQLGRGYLNRESLTAETFIDNPYFSQGHPSAKLYKTGDLARYRRDGNIEYMGRIDHQVKIRGLRIELGEIETVLARHPLVKDVAVSTFKALDGSLLLAAYIIAQSPDDTPDNTALREYMRASLPEYMLPNAFIMIDSLPLSANGKLNRKALPAPDLEGLLDTEFIAPRNDTEIAIAAIWQEILQQERVGVLDNFFEIGGHSLLATQVMSRIKEQLEVDLELKLIFEHPTVEGLAMQVLEAELSSLDEDDMDNLMQYLLEGDDIDLDDIDLDGHDLKDIDL